MSRGRLRRREPVPDRRDLDPPRSFVTPKVASASPSRPRRGQQRTPLPRSDGHPVGRTLLAWIDVGSSATSILSGWCDKARVAASTAALTRPSRSRPGFRGDHACLPTSPSPRRSSRRRWCPLRRCFRLGDFLGSATVSTAPSILATLTTRERCALRSSVVPARADFIPRDDAWARTVAYWCRPSDVVLGAPPYH